MSKAFEVGDVVRLNSGGKDMTVMSVSEDGTGCNILYFDADGTSIRGPMASACLMLRDEPSDPAEEND